MPDETMLDGAATVVEAACERLAPLIGHVGLPSFPAALLSVIGHIVRVDHCAAFRAEAPGQADLCTCLLVESRHNLASARNASARYAADYWRHDAAVTAAPPATRATVLHQAWDAIANTEFRNECYVVPAVIDRLSILSHTGDGGRLLVSVFRHRRTGFFSIADANRVAAVAPFIAACVARHADLVRPRPPANGLSPREQAVAERLAAGMTVDAVARELGLALSTAETYRKRLYAKLGAANRVELLVRLGRLR